MKTICISDLRKNLQSCIKKAAEGETLTITWRGKKLAMIVPVKKERNDTATILRSLRKNAVIGDILSPIEENWDLEK